MKKLIISLFLIITTLSIQAQTVGMGFGFNLINPTGQFKEQTDNPFIALSFNAFYHKHGTRLSYGVEFGESIYNTNKRDIPFGIRSISVEEEDGFFQLHGFLRYDLIQVQAFSFYVEARLGMTSFFSRTKLNDQIRDDEQNGLAHIMGGAAGIMIDLAAIFSKEKERSNFWFHMSFYNQSGSKVNYEIAPEKAAALQLDDDIYRSHTHSYGFNIGFTYVANIRKEL